METKPVVQSIVGGKLDDTKFWSLEAFANQPELKHVHGLIVARLQQESPDADMLELMLMERACFLYMFMRAQENEISKFSLDRNYKDMLGLWVSMAGDLRKQRLRAEETANLRAAIVSEIAKALKEALKDVDPKVANTVQAQLIHLVAV